MLLRLPRLGSAHRSAERPPRTYWADRIATLDPERDAREIVRILGQHEFCWDVQQALSFALFRTYAVPSIGGLLARTAEFTARTQKRYDDTALILDAIVSHGPDDGDGRAALRRMNRMHRSYDISPGDMRYVLSTFVVTPQRWMARYGWRPYSEAEIRASVAYYTDLGRHMGIRAIPPTFAGFCDLMDSYEQENYAFDQGARAVADASLDLLGTFPPHRFSPRAVSRRLGYALMDEHLLDAFRYPHPTKAERGAATAALRLRSAYVRSRPPRMEPLTVDQLPTIRSYPRGFDVSRLGTFPDAPGGDDEQS